MPALFHHDQIGRHHLGDKLLECRRMAPPEYFTGLGRVANKDIDLGRPKIIAVDFDQDLAALAIAAALGNALALPRYANADFGKSAFDEFAHRMSFAGCQHIIVGLVLLENPPHPLDIVSGMPPIAFGIEVPEVERILQPQINRGDGAADLTGDESLRAGGSLMIEKDAVRGVHAI